MEKEIRIYEEDGSIYADIDGRDVLLACDKDIDLKTEHAFQNIFDEIECDLTCFHERENFETLVGYEHAEPDEIKKGRLEEYEEVNH